MKKLFIFTLCILSALVVRASRAEVEESEEAVIIENNDFYDNEPSYRLRTPEIYVEGEIAEKGLVNFAELPVRSLIVKEGILEAGEVKFIGAYRFDGYSLFDILKERVLKKKNLNEFPPPLDLYVEIENADGEKVVASWGELVYPNKLNRIIVATSVSRIIPSKTKEQWPIPEVSQMVFAEDLLAERNLSEPIKITVRSATRSFPINRKLKPLYSKSIKLYKEGKSVGEIAELDNKLKTQSYKNIFYGRGRGLHKISEFTGNEIREILGKYYSSEKAVLQRGLFTVAAADGYRIVISASELFNRNDQSEFLIVDQGKDDGGKFLFFPAPDYFSDRAIKAVSEIHLDIVK
jgi:hypothetical protein